MECPKCGKTMPDDATLCTSCGWKSEKWHAGEKDAKTANVVLAVALVTIAAVFAALFVAIIFGL